jgi:SSS family solute:Na+ symporter
LFFVDVPWMDQMGYTAILTMIIIVLVSLIQHKGKDDEKGILISKKSFKTSPLFNIGSFAIMIILTAIYAVFWK